VACPGLAIIFQIISQKSRFSTKKEEEEETVIDQKRMFCFSL
jgi:hypothetical protein